MAKRRCPYARAYMRVLVFWGVQGGFRVEWCGRPGTASRVAVDDPPIRGDNFRLPIPRAQW